MKMLMNFFPKFLKQRKLLLILVLLALSCVYTGYYFLRGRVSRKEAAATQTDAFNMKLPEPLFDGKEEKMTKLDYYQRADEDSARKRAAMQQDPYYRMTQPGQPMAGKSTGRANPTGLIVDSGPLEDERADELLKKLDQFKQAMQKPVSPVVEASPGGA